MTINFSRYSLLLFCRQRLTVVICAMLACLLSGAVYAAPGQFDSTFGSAGQIVPVDFGGQSAVVGSSAVNGDGSIVVSATCSDGTVYSICARKITPAGTYDPGFGVAGVATAIFFFGAPAGSFAQPNGKLSLVLQPDGKLLVGAACLAPSPLFTTLWCVARFLPNGMLDTSFNAGGLNPGTLALNGYATSYGNSLSIALQSSGKIVIAGVCASALCLTRLTTAGIVDVTFANASVGLARQLSFGQDWIAQGAIVAVDSADHIVITGTCLLRFFSQSNVCVGRLTPNGSTDVSFANPDGLGSWFVVPAQGNTGTANDVLVQPDGRIVVLGECGNSAAVSTCLTRLLADGTFDASFTSINSTTTGTVKISLPDGFRASKSLVRQAGGKLVFAGDCSPLFPLFCVGRVNTNGTLDTSFDESPGNGNGVVLVAVGPGAGVATSVKIDGDGRIVLYGTCRNTNGTDSPCAARLQGGDQAVQACAINVDGSGSITASTDALLITRFLLGYRGVALTADALGLNPTRTGQALENHLASLNLDADGDGQALAMTDGLLMLRAMLGLTGDALTAGATNAAHPNVRNAQQILTWIEQTHGVACLP
jgi:uncharacterized delta-60 repeat protein